MLESHISIEKICLSFPLVWYLADSSGGWSQLSNKLGVNKLHFDGGSVPENKDAVADAILDLYNACIDEGATDLELPKEPLSYTELVNQLKEKGLIQAKTPTINNIPPALTPEEQQLQTAHKEQVFLYTHSFSIMGCR